MIYTVTFNPSLDYVVRVTDFELGNLHRTEAEELYVGGKGINVSTVLKGLKVENTALGFLAGFTGKELQNRMVQMGLTSDFITVKQGLSRINIKLKSKNWQETEINGQGPIPSAAELECLYEKLKALQDGDFLVLSGSVPASMEERDYCYAHICEFLKNKKIRILVDAEGSLLRNTLCYQPFLIKPNHHELGKLFSQTLLTEESIISCGKLLQKEGAQNILISMAEKGALLIDVNGRVTIQKAPKGQALNSVGAGDSMIAGFLAGLCKSGVKVSGSEYSEVDLEDALKLGVACGSAAAFSEGLPSGDLIEKTYRELKS